MTQTFFDELRLAFDAIEKLDVRCVMLTSDCKHFSTGLDLNEAMESMNKEDAVNIRKLKKYRI